MNAMDGWMNRWIDGESIKICFFILYASNFIHNAFRTKQYYRKLIGVSEGVCKKI